MNERRMYRYVVPINGQPHLIPLVRNPVAVAAPTDDYVEFWAEYIDDGDPPLKRFFQVFGTGHRLPERARWIATCARTATGLVWHLYEIDR